MGRNEYTWRKGQSGNPKGRAKKGKTFTDILAKHGNKKDVEIEGEEKKMSRKEALARIMWDMALKERDIAAIKYIYDRIDGKPVQAFTGDVEVTGNITMEDLHREADEWEAEQEGKND